MRCFACGAESVDVQGRRPCIRCLWAWLEKQGVPMMEYLAPEKVSPQEITDALRRVVGSKE
jgi:hypothetical protein